MSPPDKLALAATAGLAAVAGWVLCWAYSTNELKRERALRDTERRGRTAAERGNREKKSKAAQQSLGDGWNMKEIGRMRTPFAQRKGTPRQGTLAPHIRARLEVKSGMKVALDGLQDFSHVFVLFVFHENTNSQKGFQANLKITPPRKGEKVGVLSTRSPHRPNPLGLSVCRVESLDLKKGILTLAGVDLVDNTPILDIKPYVPYDTPDGLSIPDWVNPNDDVENKTVRWSEEALAEVAALAGEVGSGKGGGGSKASLGLYKGDPEGLRLCVEEVLAQDPRNKFERGRVEGQLSSEGVPLTKWTITVDGLECEFVVRESEVFVKAAQRV